MSTFSAFSCLISSLLCLKWSYFLQTQKADGQILLNSITKLETEAAKDARFPLQVHFKGKAEHGAGSPWMLDLDSNVRDYRKAYHSAYAW